MTKRLVALSVKASDTLHSLGEAAYDNGPLLRDLMISLAETQVGILALMVDDERLYESLRPSDEPSR